MQQRRLPIVLAALILSILLYAFSSLLLPSAAAQAHAFVIGSDPVDGSTVTTLPGKVRIFFNTSISPLSSAHIYVIQNGSKVDINAAQSVVVSGTELDTPIRSPHTQPQGSYEVIWTALASKDGHTTTGLIGFNLGFSSTGAAQSSVILGPSSSNDLDTAHTFSTNNILAIIWECLGVIALTAWLGMLMAQLLLLSDTGRSSALLIYAKKLTYSLQYLCIAAIFVSECIALFLRTTQLAQLQQQDFTLNLLFSLLRSSTYGTLWLARIILLLIALALLYVTTHHKKRKPQTGSSETNEQPAKIHNSIRLRTTQEGLTNLTTQPPATTKRVTKKLVLNEDRSDRLPSLRHTRVSLLIVLLLTLTYVFTSPAAQVLQPHLSALVFEWLYLLAQAVWFGGFAYLGYILLPVFSTTTLDNNAETLIALLRRFTPFILTGISVLLVSMLFLGDASISDPQQFINDPYGRTLLVQIVLVVIMALISAYILLVKIPKLTHQARQLPVVDAELPTRRARQAALGNTRQRLRTMTNIIALLGMAVILCVTLLAFFAPPIVFPDISYANPSASTPADNTNTTTAQTRQVGNLTVTLQLLPGRVNHDNTLLMTLTDSNGTLVTDARVAITTNMEAMDMGIDNVTLNSGNPAYTLLFNKSSAFSMAGLWDIKLVITQPGQPLVQGTFPVMIKP